MYIGWIIKICIIGCVFIGGSYCHQRRPYPYFSNRAPIAYYGRGPVVGGGGGGGRLQCQFDSNCFCYSNGCTLMNANPYDRRTPVSCEQCLNSCLQQQRSYGNGPACRSVVYDAQYQSCDLYAVNAMAMPQRLTKWGTRVYFQPTGRCSGGTPAPATTMAPIATDCPAGQTAKLVAIKDYQYPGFTGTTVPNVDANGCVQACMRNQLPDGTAISCKSSQYGPGNQCVLSTSQGTLPEANGQKTPADLVKNCGDVIEEYPQKILIGQNRQTVDSTSMQDCIQKCLNSQQLYGFVCTSGMYYYQESTLSCILNTETKSTKPDLFTDAPDDKVTYFEPGCNGGQRLAKVAKSMKGSKDQPLIPVDWTLWSPCDTNVPWKILYQYRFKPCQQKDPRSCEQQARPCSNSTDAQTDSGSDANILLVMGDKQVFRADNAISDGNATRSFTPCRAIMYGNKKNCTMGMQTVDEQLRYCRHPVDC